MTLREYVDRRHPFKAPVDVVKILEGSKKAFLFNGKVCISPAMMALVDGATHEELERLFGSIELVDIGTFDPLAMDYLPMASQP